MASWYTDIAMCLRYWRKKQGPVVYLFLPDKIQKSCNGISVTGLNKENWLNALITKIKTLYAKDINALAYMTYDQFENFKRPDEITIADYIKEFERLNNKIHQFDMVLPTGVLAYKVLNNINISLEKKQLISTTIVLSTYENMIKQLQAIYDSSANSSTNELVDIKSELAYYTNNHEFVNEIPKDVIVFLVTVFLVIVIILVILETEVGMQNSRIQLQETMTNLVRKQIC